MTRTLAGAARDDPGTPPALSRQLRINGGLVAALGCAHLAIAVPSGATEFEPLSAATAAMANTANAATGLAVLLVGLLAISAAGQPGRWAGGLVAVGGLLVLVVCVGYLVSLPTNPFAYAGLLLSLWTVALGWRRTRSAPTDRDAVPAAGPGGPQRI